MAVLFVFGLLFGSALAPTLSYYAGGDPRPARALFWALVDGGR